jgi:hypothetical protein
MIIDGVKELTHSIVKAFGNAPLYFLGGKHGIG